MFLHNNFDLTCSDKLLKQSHYDFFKHEIPYHCL